MSKNDDRLVVIPNLPLDTPVGEGELCAFKEEMLTCQLCPLHETRNKVVFGEGLAETPLVAFIGEAPGPEEDRQGRPFVGRAGRLLDRMLDGMGLLRTQVFLCNIIGCQTPDNRKPTSEEIIQCKGWWEKMLRAVKPKIIVTLGESASRVVLDKPSGLDKLRGKWKKWEGVPVMATYHPAFLLKKEGKEKKPKCWADLKQVMAKLKEL